MSVSVFVSVSDGEGGKVEGWRGRSTQWKSLPSGSCGVKTQVVFTSTPSLMVFLERMSPGCKVLILITLGTRRPNKGRWLEGLYPKFLAKKVRGEKIFTKKNAQGERKFLTKNVKR